jgi:cyclic pyranopterin phosphate synthase
MTTTPFASGATHGGALTHVDDRGQVRMVDVTAKPRTRRVAIARCVVVTTADVRRLLSHQTGALNVIEAARFAGIQAAKRTASLIPLCHPILLDRISIEVDVGNHGVEVRALTAVVERTGVEMEALTACAITALSVLGSLVDIDPEASIEELTIWHKSGGRSGDWARVGRAGPMRNLPPQPLPPVGRTP